MRHVYFGEPLDLDAFPNFCTDGQAGCNPFKLSDPELSDGASGD
jgi:hypothetical protein